MLKKICVLALAMCCLGLPILMPYAKANPINNINHKTWSKLDLHNLKNLKLTADQVYEVLKVEFALQNKDFATAAKLGMKYARQYNVPHLAMRAAQAYLGMEEYKLAIDSALIYVRANPLDIDFLNYVILSSVQAGYYQNLDAVFREQLSWEEDVHVLLNIADVLANFPDKVRAYDLYREIISDHKYQNTYLGQLLLADFAAMAEKDFIAFQTAKKAHAISPDSPDAIESILNYSAPNQKDEALNLACKYLERNPKSQDEYLIIINHMFDLRRYEQALDLALKAQLQWPDNHELQYLIARINFAMGDLEESKRRFENILKERDGKHAKPQENRPQEKNNTLISNCHLWLGYIHLDQDNERDAIESFKQVSDPEIKLTASVELAQIYLKENSLEEAVKVLRLYPYRDEDDHLQVLKTIVAYYKKHDQIAKAIEYVQEELDSFNNPVEVEYELGLLYAEQGKYELAEQKLLEVLQMKPEFAQVYNDLAYLYLEQNTKLPLAELYLERAMRLLPNNAVVLDTMGWLMYRLAKYDEAIEYFQSSLASELSASAAAHLAQVFGRTGQKEKAMQLLEQARVIDKNDEAYLRAKHELGQ